MLRNQPDETTADLIDQVSNGQTISVACLFPDPISAAPVDWDRLVEDIFSHERVICW